MILIAQDLTYYGLDLYKERRLGALLKELVKVEGIEWIRLHYLFPSGFPQDVLDIIREEPKVCAYLDIPLQHIAAPVLKSMRRGTTKAKTDAFVALMPRFGRSGGPDGTAPLLSVRLTRFQGYKLQVTSYKLQATSYNAERPAHPLSR